MFLCLSVWCPSLFVPECVVPFTVCVWVCGALHCFLSLSGILGYVKKKKLPYMEITSGHLWSRISNWTIYWIFMKFSVAVIYKSCQTSFAIIVPVSHTFTEGLTWISACTFHICQSVGLSSVQKICIGCCWAVLSVVTIGAIQTVLHLGE